MAWETGLGAQQGRTGARMADHDTASHAHDTASHAHDTSGSTCARGLAGGLCRDTINCIMTRGSLAAGLYHDAARSNAAIRRTELQYARHNARKGARGIAAIRPRGGLQHDRLCLRHDQAKPATRSSVCALCMQAGLGCAPGAPNPVLDSVHCF